MCKIGPNQSMKRVSVGTQLEYIRERSYLMWSGNPDYDNMDSRSPSWSWRMRSTENLFWFIFLIVSFGYFCLVLWLPCSWNKDASRRQMHSSMLLIILCPRMLLVSNGTDLFKTTRSGANGTTQTHCNSTVTSPDHFCAHCKRMLSTHPLV